MNGTLGTPFSLFMLPEDIQNLQTYIYVDEMKLETNAYPFSNTEIRIRIIIFQYAAVQAHRKIKIKPRTLRNKAYILEKYYSFLLLLAFN